MSLSLTELKKLHDKGLALIYLRPKTKRPFEPGWTTQAPKSWDELENSFEKTYNVGVRLGTPSKLSSGNYLGAIDCDVKCSSRKALREMNEELRKLGIDLISAPIVMSGRGNGSRHIYVQTLKPMKPCTFIKSKQTVKVHMPGESRPHSKLEMRDLTESERKEGFRIRPAWEISFMGDGQQTVLPPSIHPDSGMKYDWASPLTVKYLPLFNPEKFIAVRQNTNGKTEGKSSSEINFKAVDVDLKGSKLAPSMVDLIVNGRGCEDRSAALMVIAMSMCRAGFNDNEILSVLSDPNNYIAGAAYDRRHGRRSAVEWLYKHTLIKARYETSPMRYFDNPPTKKERSPISEEKAVAVGEAIDEDLNRVLPDRTRDGRPQSSLRNLVHVLTHFMDGPLVGFNEFSNRPFFLRDTEYGGKKGQELADHHDLALKHHIACTYRFEPPTSICFEAHSIVARENQFHPVQTYLKGLEWDGKPRLDEWLSKAFSARGPKEYLKAVGRKTLVAAVKRIFQPGCKFDHVLVLEGNQGEGKSMSLSILASPQWFTDGLGDIHNKDVVDQMTGKWMIELSELASIRGKESEYVKAFLTRQVDRVRMSYGKRSEDYPRQSIFLGSTNSSEYFTDETGNRRYWPVKVGEANTAWLKRNRDQLWAEAMVRFDLGEDLYLTKDLEMIARKEQEKRFEVDDWEDLIKEKVKDDKPRDVHTTNEIYSSIVIGGIPSMVDSKRIGRVMVRLGFTRSTQRINGVPKKCWMKK